MEGTRLEFKSRCIQRKKKINCHLNTGKYNFTDPPMPVFPVKILPYGES